MDGRVSKSASSACSEWTTPVRAEYVYVQKHGHIPSRADYVLEAVPADDEVAALLELAPGQPLLYASETTFDQDGRPIELCRISYRWDRFRFHTSLSVRVPRQ